MKIKLTATLIFVFVVQAIVSAQNSPVVLPRTEMHFLHSEIVNQDFGIYVKLPWSYQNTDVTYPVLFTTDANRTFPIYSTLSLIYETPGTGNEEIVIVGIGYKVNPNSQEGLAEWAYLRNRDLRPERSLESEAFWKKRLSGMLDPDFDFVPSGNAARFLKFIREELIPFVETNYRVSKNDRGIAGYSLGGLFTLYSLFQAPETFNSFFAGSPSEIQLCIQSESNYATNHNHLDANVFVSVTDSEARTKAGIMALKDSLLSRGYPDFHMSTYTFADENHTSGGAAAISRALRELYYK